MALTFDLDLPVKDYTRSQRDLLFYGVDSPQFRRHFPGRRAAGDRAPGAL